MEFDNGKRKADCGFVVPYNPYLLKKFNCHMNVEVCSGIRAVKYLYKVRKDKSDIVQNEATLVLLQRLRQGSDGLLHGYFA